MQEHDRGRLIKGDEITIKIAVQHPLTDRVHIVLGDAVDGDIARHDIMEVKPLLGDFEDLCVGRPQGEHAGPVNAGQVTRFFGDGVELLEEVHVPHVTGLAAQADHNQVRARQLLLILEIGLHIGVFERHLLEEARFHAPARHGEVAADNRHCRHEYEDGRTPAENDVFDDLHSTIPLERPLRMRACSPAPHRVRGLRP